MARFILFYALLLLLFSCGFSERAAWEHDVPREYIFLTDDVEGSIALPVVEYALGGDGDYSDAVEVSYFYIEAHKDTLFWEEGSVKIPVNSEF